MTRSAATPLLGARSEQAIGDRPLIAVQTIDIGRLSGHVVPLTPGGFIPVSGEGDQQDSNGSGKTTFLAVVSLLLGDPQWRMGNSQGDELINLLFDPTLAGAAGAGMTAAGHGYVIGAFGVESSDIRSVWMRINRESRAKLGPLQVRVYDGFCVARGLTDTARAEAADARWAEDAQPLEFGMREYALQLFGSRPRVSAYVRSRGGRGSGPSLLAAEVDRFEPATIGAELLRLCGQEELLQHDAKQHRERAVTRKDRAEAIREDEVAQMREAAELETLDRLDAARTQLRSADQAWTDHFACQLADGEAALGHSDEQIADGRSKLTSAALAFDRCQRAVNGLSDVRDLQAEIARLESEQSAADTAVSAAESQATKLSIHVDTLLKDLREQRRQAQGRSASLLPVALERRERAETAHAETAREQDRLAYGVDRATGRLEQVQATGRAETAAALAALDAAHVTSACGLLDALEVPTGLRDALEPALVPYRDAVVVIPEERATALAALADLPGTMVVSGDGAASLPTGVAVPAGAGRFIEHLLEYATVGDEGHVQVGFDEVTVVAPLSQRITGRDAAIAAAQADLDIALSAAEAGAASLRLAEQALDAACDEVRCAEAAARASDLQGDLTAARETHAQARRQAGLERDAREAIRAQLGPALGRLASHDADRRAADVALAEARTKRDEAKKELAALERTRADQARALVANPFADRPEEARHRAEAVGLDESTLRRNAGRHLDSALRELSIDPYTGSGAEHHDPEIVDVAARHRAMDGDEGRESRMPFKQIAGPLMSYLERRAERDVEQRDRILRARRERAARIEGYDATLSHLEEELRNLAESIEQSVRARLREVGRRFDQLDRENGGYGAQLEVNVTPAGDTTDWIVAVEPRWARGPGERAVSYKRPGNTAMKKQRTINLVLAALLDENRAQSGSVLILDELGDSLGQHHRLSVLGAIAEAAAAAGITVLATCQDSMLDAAGQFAKLVVYFRYLGGAEVVNRAPALYGYDAQGTRVRVTAEAVFEGRPLA